VSKMKRNKNKEKPLIYAIPISIELAGIFIILVGIAVELSTGAELGNSIITLGSTIVALGSLLWAKILRGVRERHGRNRNKGAG